MSEEVSGRTVVIHASGDADLGKDQRCTWHTINGTTSSLTITNTGENTLTISVAGAPDDIQASGPGGPARLNGSWAIPPDQPNVRVVAFGNFQGTIVSLMNMSNPATTCHVVATAG